MDAASCDGRCRPSGTAMVESRRELRRWAHPRAGPAREGGSPHRRQPSRRSTGRPRPRGRGRRCLSSLVSAMRGLTPGRAGTARGRVVSISPSRAHPRAGGDGGFCPPSATVAKGSPPRGRGRPGFQWPCRLLEGLTPARAGTAWPIVTAVTEFWAHPRAGGDESVSASEDRRHIRQPHQQAGSDRVQLPDVPEPVAA